MSEGGISQLWRVMAEHAGAKGPLILRAGFETQEAAEDHPVTMAKWKRVWVEQYPAPRPPSNRLPPLPWHLEMAHSPTANGSFHTYLVDANGKKLAAVWGKGREKALICEHIMAALEAHEADVKKAAA